MSAWYPAHSDCCFLRRVQIFLLTYLLTMQNHRVVPWDELHGILVPWLSTSSTSSVTVHSCNFRQYHAKWLGSKNVSAMSCVLLSQKLVVRKVHAGDPPVGRCVNWGTANSWSTRWCRCLQSEVVIYGRTVRLSSVVWLSDHIPTHEASYCLRAFSSSRALPVGRTALGEACARGRARCGRSRPPCPAGRASREDLGGARTTARRRKTLSQSRHNGIDRTATRSSVV